MKLNGQKVFLDSLISKQETSEDGSIIIEGYANTVGKDRAGDVIPKSTWEKPTALSNFMKNPIILAYHDHSQPIGVALEVYPDEYGLRLKAKISEAAGNVYKLIKDGVLKAFSVGFRLLDAEYKAEAEIFLIKDLELFEVSVVSVPCNQDSTFSLSKSLEESGVNVNEFKNQFAPKVEPNVTNEEKLKMDPKEIELMLQKALKEQKEQEEKAAREKADKEAAEKALNEKIGSVAIAAAQEVLKGAKEAMDKSDAAFAKFLKDNEEVIKTMREEIASVANVNSGRFNRTAVAKEFDKETEKAMDSAVLLSLAMSAKGEKVGIFDTTFGQSVRAKVNQSSSAEVSSDAYETVFATNLMRDIEHRLVIKPLFQEVSMTSANLTVPVMPGHGYASWVGANTYGTEATTGAEIKFALTDVTLVTHKLAGKVFLTDETAEDTIIAMLPLLRMYLVEAHVNSIELAFLRGTGLNEPKGLIPVALADGKKVNTTAKADGSVKVTGEMLIAARRKLGLRGLELNNLAVIISMDAYYDLLEDPEWRDVSMVGESNATKLTGQVGRIGNMDIMVCGEFEAKSADKAFGIIVHKPTFVVPRQRQATVETDYSVEQQRRVIVATQRLNLQRYFDGEGVVSLAYAAA